MGSRLNPEQRDQFAADAAARYESGEAWQQIGATYGITGAHVRLLTVARHRISDRRWGQSPVAGPLEVRRRREEGQTLDEIQIARALDCSRQAVRSALEAAGSTPATRYPRLSQRREPKPDEIERVRELYESCPEAPRGCAGAHDVRGSEGRTVAQACRELVISGVPMQALSRAIGRGPTWMHRLLSIHDLRRAPC